MTSGGAAKIPPPEDETAEEVTKTRVDVDVRYSMVPEWILDHEQSGLSANAVRLYAVLARFGNSEGGARFPSRALLAARMGVSKLDTVDRAGKELRAAKALFVRSGKATGRPNTYVLAFSPPTPLNGVPPSTGYPPERDTGYPVERGTTDRSLQKEAIAYAIERVRTAWLEHAPPLINHRPTFFDSAKVKTAVSTATKVYPVDTVVEAVGLYATTLGSEDYTWSYSWTLLDFLKRGLDRFVPEADPLTNFARRTTTRNGRDRGVTFGELLKMGGTDDDAGAGAAHQIHRVAQG